MFPAARIVTVEPSSENFRLLKANTSKFPNIVSLNFALHTHGGEKVALRRGPDTTEWGFSMVDQGDNSPFEEVETISLAEVFSGFADGREIGLVKMDIEGAELAILRENADSLQRASVVVIELHDRFVPGCTEAFEEFSRGRTIVPLPGEKMISLRRP
jgi:FkbM family methyltransferase